MANDLRTAEKTVTPFDTQVEQRYNSNTVQGIEQGYDTSTWGNSDGGDYEAISVGRFIKAYDEQGIHVSSGRLPVVRNLVLDPNENYTVGTNSCSVLNLCVPNINVPQGVIDLANNLVGKESYTYKTIEEINKLAEEVDKVPEARTLIEILSANYTSLSAQLREQLNPKLKALILDYSIPDKVADYKDLSAYKEADFPELNITEDTESKEIQELINKLGDLSIDESDIPLITVSEEELTERIVDGSGAFDHIATSIFNQLMMARKNGLVSQNEIAQIYSQFLVQGIQTATEFVIQKKSLLQQSYMNRVNAIQANIAVYQAKAQMLMMPAQIRLAYAQLQAQLKQIELLKVQTEIEKEKYPQIIAQTDQILAQTDGQRLQNEFQQVQIQQGKLSLEQGKEQAKQQVIQTNILENQYELSEHQVEQAKEQTKQMALSNNKLIEDTKMVDAQVQLQLKQVELADIQKIQAKAQIKAMAQQLEKEKENLGLLKAQTATAYAQLSVLTEQLKAAKAQYSDTIDGQPIGGVLGAQINVNKAQVVGFERSAFNNFFSQLQAGWSAKKTADIATLSPNGFNALGVDRALNWYATKFFNMPNDIFEMPNGYTDYLTDEQMDGTTATPSTSNSKVSS